MRTQEELAKRIEHYVGAKYIYRDYGYIAWQMSTGDNIEIIFVEVKEPRKGYGRQLLKDLVEAVKPYHSIFVVRLASNEVAGSFYRRFGFKETRLTGLYRGDDAVIGIVPYEELCKNL